MSEMYDFKSAPVPPPIPQQSATGPMLDYATPLAGDASAPFWAEGKILVTRVQCELPYRCVRCNAPATWSAWRKYYYYPQWVLLLLLVNILVMAIVALCVRKKADVRLCLCETHLGQRTNRIRAAWGVFAVALVGGIVSILALSTAFGQSNESLGAVGLVIVILMMLVALIIGSNAANVLRVVKADAQYARFKGAGPEFLATLPNQ
ncbi:MAG TPA: hypothetical protein VGB55_10975 [Tepidisphaeraceae bacterium]